MEVVGYLLEELRDGKNYEAFKADMQTANVFIGSLIFIEELADKVRNTDYTCSHSMISKVPAACQTEADTLFQASDYLYPVG